MTAPASEKPVTAINTREYSLHYPAKEKLEKQTWYANMQKDTSLYQGVNLGEGQDFPILSQSYEDGKCVVAQAKGDRHSQEDSFHSTQWGAFVLDIVCDGHQDEQQAGQHVCTNLPIKLKAYLPDSADEAAITNALTRACVELDQEYHGGGGTTLVGTLTHAGKIYFFNVGDSRGALLQPGGAIDYMTLDAKPILPIFQKALQKEKLESAWFNGAWRVVDKQGDEIGPADGLAMARDIGLPKISPRPKMSWADYQPGQVLILATDGVWDFITKAEIKNIIMERRAAGKGLSEIATFIVRTICDRDPGDNITLLLRELS